MPVPKVDDTGFKKLWYEGGCNPKEVATALKQDVASVLSRRRRYAQRTGEVLPTVAHSNNKRGVNGFGVTDWTIVAPAYKPRIDITLRDGYIVAFSDIHVWPRITSLATEALWIVLKELKPKLVICNGDLVDGARISRHPRLGWDNPPDLVDELYAARVFMAEAVRLTPKARHIFTAGNHDSRFDRYLAANAPMLQGIKGSSLKDHFPDWDLCYAVMVNEDTEPSYFIHANRGGVHAPRNNVLAAGCTVFTGHLHSQKSMPVTTLVSEFDGVDCGMLADRDGPQFAYVSSRPTDWREGFAVQYYDKDGYRHPAELARVKYQKNRRRAFFRGRVIAERKLNARAS